MLFKTHQTPLQFLFPFLISITLFHAQFVVLSYPLLPDNNSLSLDYVPNIFHFPLHMVYVSRLLRTISEHSMSFHYLFRMSVLTFFSILWKLEFFQRIALYAPPGITLSLHRPAISHNTSALWLSTQLHLSHSAVLSPSCVCTKWMFARSARMTSILYFAYHQCTSYICYAKWLTRQIDSVWMWRSGLLNELWKWVLGSRVLTSISPWLECVLLCHIFTFSSCLHLPCFEWKTY